LSIIFLVSHVTDVKPHILTQLSIVRDSQSPFGYSAPEQLDEDAQFRNALASVRPVDVSNHSRTLGIVDGIFVISLKRRQDRRDTMDSIARALDLDFQYVDATDFKTPEGLSIMKRIIDRVRWQRNRIDDREAEPSDWPKQSDANRENDKTFIWNAFPFQWSQDVLSNVDDPLATPFLPSGADYWDVVPHDVHWERAHPLPPWTAEEKEAKVYVASEKNVQFRNQFLTNAVVSCWHSHVKVLRQIVQRKLSAAIVFEDDIDIEWDVERLLRLSWPALPDDWDIVFLGHCYSREHENPMLPGAALIHPTKHALCTHGYAISQRGAVKLLRFLRSPDYAYSRPIDHAIKDLWRMALIKSYSVYPPVVIQTKNDVSDITGAVEKQWSVHEALVDSTLERLEMLQAAAY